jgi:2-(1,2-epoxy-1,2-dihydrophenyl)acetyl-CoA isomerase
LAILGEKIGAEEARQFGLVNFVVPDAQVESKTEELAKKITDAPRRSVQWAKRLMNDSLDNSLETQLQGEAQGFGECAGSDDFAEGVSAFLEKRAARFNRDGD